MRVAVHLFSLSVGVVVVTVLTHEQHMRLGAMLDVVMLLGFGLWMVFGTSWWLIGLFFRGDDNDRRQR
jgi:hypothetical protein